jgi:hypothetical protein
MNDDFAIDCAIDDWCIAQSRRPSSQLIAYYSCRNPMPQCSIRSLNHPFIDDPIDHPIIGPQIIDA